MKKIIAERKYFALLVIAVMGVFLFYAAFPLLAGIAGAAIFYVLFKPVYLGLLKRLGGRKTLSAVLVILLSLVLITVPITYIMYLSLVEMGHILADVETLQAMEGAIGPVAASLGYQYTGVADFLQAHIQAIVSIVEEMTIIAIDNTASISINVVVLYLIFFYSLTEHEKVAKAVRELIPFSENNASELMKEFTATIRTTVIGNGAASVVLGVLLAAGLVLAGADHFFFWALVGTIMAFMPIIGIQIIWIPAGAFYLLTGNYAAGAGIIIWGAFLSYIADGFVRQRVQKKVGEMHPLISLLGLIIGIAYFGIMGIIIGPLILAVFILMLKMFREEYLQEW